MGVDGLEGADADLGVDLGGVEAGVAEELLDVADIGAGLVHVGRAAVAQKVAGSRLGNACLAQAFLDPVPEVLRVEAGAVATDKESTFLQVEFELRARAFEVAPKPVTSLPSERNHPAFPTFAFADGEHVAGEFDVFDVEVNHFVPAQSAGVKDF